MIVTPSREVIEILEISKKAGQTGRHNKWAESCLDDLPIDLGLSLVIFQLDQIQGRWDLVVGQIRLPGAIACPSRVVRTENSVLAMKSTFFDNAAPISSSH